MISHSPFFWFMAGAFFAGNMGLAMYGREGTPRVLCASLALVLLIIVIIETRLVKP